MEENTVIVSNDWAIRGIQKEREKRGGKCQWADLCPGESCDRTFDLQFAHIKETKLSGRGRGSGKRLRDIRQNGDCYKLLCDVHHRRYDKAEVDDGEEELD